MQDDPLGPFVPPTSRASDSQWAEELRRLLASERTPDRRAFLRYLAASPLLGGIGLGACASNPRSEAPSGAAGSAMAEGAHPALPDEVLNVLDFEPLARGALPPAHFGYIATGVEGDRTLRANREGFSHYYLRARRLIDVRSVDTSIELFGVRWKTPIILAPAGSQRAFHPEGEIAVARAARSREHLQVLSTVATTSVEDVAEARGEPIWYQLYPTTVWEHTQRMIARAEAAGCAALVLTVDLQAGGLRETLERAVRADDRNCARCHTPGRYIEGKPMLHGLEEAGPFSTSPRGMTWEFARRVRDQTSMRFLIKGIVTAEDTHLAIASGVDGIVVSNHGGRGEESGRATIDSLPEVVRAAAGRVPVIVDGGFRRGGDIVKALAMGADAIQIGRPYLWGLAAFGEDGVARVLDILTGELETAMRQVGATRVDELGPRSIGRA